MHGPSWPNERSDKFARIKDEATVSKMPVAARTKRLLDTEGKAVAAVVHNASVAQAFESAKEGAVINLTDLMISAEHLHLAE